MKKVFTSGLFLCLFASNGILGQIPTDGLVAYYPFNGNANDESGQNNNGIVHGATLTTDRCGENNKAYYFNGIDEYIEVPYNFSLTEVTVCGWINADQIPQEGAVIFKTSEYFSDTWGLYLRDDLHILEDIDDHNLQIYHTTITSDWHFFTAVLTDDLVNKLYVDGVLVGTGQLSLDDWASYQGQLYIGQRGTSSWNGFFSGKIDDIRIFNRELSPSEILSLFYFDCQIIKINGINEVCQGQQDVSYAVNSIENAKYSWDYSGTGVTITGNSENVSLDFDNNSSDGILSVTVSGDNISTQTTTFSIAVNPLPGDAGVVSGELSVCPDHGANYSVLPISNATSYLWSYDGTGASIIENSNRVLIYFSEGATGGNLFVEGINSCGPGIRSSTFNISVIPCNNNPNDFDISIPNAFSPNGDGINDLFVISGLPENSQLIIFNRDGKELYASDNYLNDWNGKDKDGHILETGTYWFVFKLAGIPEEIKGFVYIKK